LASQDQDSDLREAARARGFRLVKSRRRKPGGDFGRYGLADQKGRECMGFGPDGLTATADEVRAYLRGGEVASWKRSLIGVVGAEEGEQPAQPTRPEPTSTARPERSRGTVPVRTEPTPSARLEPFDAACGGAQDKLRPIGRSRETPAPEPKAAASSSSRGTSRKPSPPPPAKRPSTSLGTSGEGGRKAGAQITIREATRRDTAALARLLDLPAATLAERLAAAISADEPPLVATGDRVVGIAAYTIVQTLQHGPRARLTLLLIAEPERRQGLGTRLLEAVEQRLADAGITDLELNLEIDFDAPTGFLRRTGWTRTTNGYAKALP